LTIIVNNSNNKSFTLIHNLPFNVSGYTDILIVLKQVFEINIFYSRDMLDSIVFKYHFENENNYKRDLYITNLFMRISSIIITLILLLCTFIIFLEIYSINSIEYIDTEILNYAYESIKNSNYQEFNEISSRRSIFTPFIELFNNYNFPSKFVDRNLNSLGVLEPLNNQDVTTMHKTVTLNFNRIEAYQNLTRDLIPLMLHYAPPL
jgi:hypothetical protein